jgi:hypothetical protein
MKTFKVKEKKIKTLLCADVGLSQSYDPVTTSSWCRLGKTACQLIGSKTP